MTNSLLSVPYEEEVTVTTIGLNWLLLLSCVISLWCQLLRSYKVGDRGMNVKDW